MGRWARTMCPAVAAMALAVAFGCASQPSSPVAPGSVNAAASGDAVWFDPAYRTFYLDANHDAWLVDVNDSTRFVGKLHSVYQMSVAYAAGHRVRVSVLGVEGYDSTRHRVLASSVDAQAFDTYLMSFGGGGSPVEVTYSEPQFNRLVLESAGRWEVFVTPSTILDPSGDFTTFDGLIAGMERDDVKYISGEGWQVAQVGQLARTMKATRQPR